MKLNVLPALLLPALLLTACNSTPQNSSTAPVQPSARQSRATTATATGPFDLYLLNLSWSPEYCHTHANAQECAAHDTFVLHGLWPENNDGTYPQNCSNAPGPTNLAPYSGLYPDPGLLQHEWQTHGTCTGLSPDAYFQAVRTASNSVKIPGTFQNLSAATSMTPAEIETQFTQSNPSIPSTGVVVSCGNNFLTAVEVCMDKSLHPIACPTGIKSCHANTVRVPAPR